MQAMPICRSCIEIDGLWWWTNLLAFFASPVWARRSWIL
tara:strand:+ start:1918 stop:2034 length:117 start_codon:yes stop_codon:yes gene_type:complete